MHVRIQKGIVTQVVEQGKVKRTRGFVYTAKYVECNFRAIPPKRSQDRLWNFESPPGPTEEELRNTAMNNLRIQRDLKLKESDWTQGDDGPENKKEWAVYRKALRNMPAVVDPFNFTWPEKPA